MGLLAVLRIYICNKNISAREDTLHRDNVTYDKIDDSISNNSFKSLVVLCWTTNRQNAFSHLEICANKMTNV